MTTFTVKPYMMTAGKLQKSFRSDTTIKIVGYTRLPMHMGCGKVSNRQSDLQDHSRSLVSLLVVFSSTHMIS